MNHIPIIRCRLKPYAVAGVCKCSEISHRLWFLRETTNGRNRVRLPMNSIFPWEWACLGFQSDVIKAKGMRIVEYLANRVKLENFRIVFEQSQSGVCLCFRLLCVCVCFRWRVVLSSMMCFLSYFIVIFVPAYHNMVYRAANRRARLIVDVVVIVVIVVCLTYLNSIGMITGTKTLYTRFSPSLALSLCLSWSGEQSARAEPVLGRTSKW